MSTSLSDTQKLESLGIHKQCTETRVEIIQTTTEVTIPVKAIATMLGISDCDAISLIVGGTTLTQDDFVTLKATVSNEVEHEPKTTQG